jgi:hypothetical protein
MTFPYQNAVRILLFLPKFMTCLKCPDRAQTCYPTFQKKIKVDLSSHQSVCLCVCMSVCPPLITLNHLVDFHKIWYRGNVIQGDLDVIIFVPYL